MAKTVKCAFVMAALAMALLFSGCVRGGNVENVRISEWEPSELYSDADIEAAMQAVEEYFSREFRGCTLTELSYPGDDYVTKYGWAGEYDEVIALLSSFDVDASGGDGSFNPNSTYTDWEWTFVRNAGGEWQHKDHGY